MKDIKLDNGLKCFIYFLGFPILSPLFVISNYWDKSDELNLFCFWLNLRNVTLTKNWEKIIYVVGCVQFSLWILLILYIIFLIMFG